MERLLSQVKRLPCKREYLSLSSSLLLKAHCSGTHYIAGIKEYDGQVPVAHWTASLVYLASSRPLRSLLSLLPGKEWTVPED